MDLVSPYLHQLLCRLVIFVLTTFCCNFTEVFINSRNIKYLNTIIGIRELVPVELKVNLIHRGVKVQRFMPSQIRELTADDAVFRSL